MLQYGLCCLRHSVERREAKHFAYRDTTKSSAPSLDKLREIYIHNLHRVIDYCCYCKAHGIQSYRVPSSIFPLSTLDSYVPAVKRLLLEDPEIQALYSRIKAIPMHKTTHPGQFILISSASSDVNSRSIRELNMWGVIGERMGIDVINIHVGSRANGAEAHLTELARSLDRLRPEARTRLSLENCEKSYSLLDTLEFCQAHDVRMCLDLHHNRVHQVKLGNSIAHADRLAHLMLPYIKATWGTHPMVMHISSPLLGSYDGNLRDMCKHADYIDPHDVPPWLPSVDGILEVEAKHKEVALFRLRDQLDHMQPPLAA